MSSWQYTRYFLLDTKYVFFQLTQITSNDLLLMADTWDNQQFHISKIVCDIFQTMLYSLNILDFLHLLRTLTWTLITNCNCVVSFFVFIGGLQTSFTAAYYHLLHQSAQVLHYFSQKALAKYYLLYLLGIKFH